MTTLSSFNKTDLVDDHDAADVNELISASLLSKYKNVETLSATRTLLDGDTPIQRYECGAADRIVKAPTADAVNNHPFWIVNASAAARVITFQNAGGTKTIATINQGKAMLFAPDGNGSYIAATNAELPAGYLYGLTLTNNGTDPTNDIDIAVGKCRDSTDVINLILASAITKRLDAAWAVGTNQGGLDTGSIANTTYHVWLIMRSDTGVVDALFSASASAPSMPTNYDYKRRIGSIVRASGAIKLFIQDGDDFYWSVPVADVSATNPGTAAVTRTLTVPTGIRVKAIMKVTLDAVLAADEPGSAYISDLSVADTTPSISVGNLHMYANVAAEVLVGAEVRTWTNTSAQVRSRLQSSATNTTLSIGTLGWIDPRGRI